MMLTIINNLLAVIKCKKIINVLALASTAVSIAVVGTGAYVYVNKDSIIESVTEKALGGIGGGLGGDLQ